MHFWKKQETLDIAYKKKRNVQRFFFVFLSFEHVWESYVF